MELEQNPNLKIILSGDDAKERFTRVFGACPFDKIELIEYKEGKFRGQRFFRFIEKIPKNR